MSNFKKLFAGEFTAKKVALAGIFSALSYVVSFAESPLFAAAPFFKLDLSFSILLIGAFMYGPILGETSLIAVQALRLPMSGTQGIGELANLICGTLFIFIPSLIYMYKKGLPTVILSLILGSSLQILGALISNRFLMFPLYMGKGAATAFTQFFWYIVAFNLIKCLLNALIAFFLYKRLRKILNKWFF